MMQLIYEKLPKDIASRHVLFLDPVLATGLHYTHFTFYNLKPHFKIHLLNICPSHFTKNFMFFYFPFSLKIIMPLKNIKGI